MLGEREEDATMADDEDDGPVPVPILSARSSSITTQVSPLKLSSIRTHSLDKPLVMVVMAVS